MSRSALNHPFAGSEELSRVLQGLSGSVRAEILLPACVKAAAPIQSATRRLAAKRTGALKASIAVKGISDKTRGTAAALIGPDRNYYHGGKRIKKGGDRRGADKPSNYAHLVEFGHVTGASSARFGGFGKKTSIKKGTATATAFVLPRPFMRPGFTAGAPAAEAIMQREIAAGIEKTRARLVREGAHKA